MLVEIMTEMRDDGAITLTASTGRAVWRLGLDPRETTARRAWVANIMAWRDDFDCTSYWRSGDDAHDQRRAALDEAYLRLYEWDLLTIVRPLFDVLERRFQDTAWVIIGEGRPILPFFSVRGALRAGVMQGRIVPAFVRSVCPLHAWTGRGCAAMAEFVEPVRLPRFRPEAIHVLLCPPPAELELYFGLFAQREGRLDITELVQEALDLDRNQIAAMYVRGSWQELLSGELEAVACSLGVQFSPRASLADLLEVVAAGDPARMVVLVAHQDEAGIHFADGPVPLNELAAALGVLRDHGIRPCGSVDLGVCHAEDEANLAECFQAFGVPVVHTHGHFAHYARVLGAWVWALRALQRHATAMSLPELLDEGWLAGLADARRHAK